MRGGSVVAIVGLLSAPVTARADDVVFASIPSVIDRQWALHLAYGGARMTVNREHYYVVFQLGLHYRVNPFIEFGGSLFGGGFRNFAQAALYGDVRIRLTPENAWDPFLLGSIGLAATSTNTARGMGGASLRLGAGIERRFTHWGFALELNGFVIDDARDAPGGGSGPGATLLMSANYYWGRGTPTHRELRGP